MKFERARDIVRAVGRGAHQEVTERVRAAAVHWHGTIPRRTLDDLGVSDEAIRTRLASGELVRTGRGLYVVPAAADEWTELVVRLAGSTLLAASHRVAAAIWGWDGFDRLPRPLLRDPEIVTPWTSRHTLRAHRRRDLGRADLVTRSPFRVTSPVWTLGTLGEVAIVDQDRLEQAVECALRQKHVTEADLWRWVATHTGPAAELLQAVLRLRGRGTPATGSLLETLALQRVLRPHGIDVLGRQVDVWVGDQWLCRPDFLLDGWTFLELDGSRHRDPHRVGRDKEQDRRLGALGLRVLRAEWSQVTASRGTAGVLATQIHQWMEDGRAAHPEGRPPFDGRSLRFGRHQPSSHSRGRPLPTKGSSNRVETA